MTHNIKPNKRILGYDICKALAAFLIVLYHLQLVDFGFQEGTTYYPTFIKTLWSLSAAGVPLFFMVNGALTVRRTISLNQLIKKCSKILFVAIFWTCLLSCLLNPIITHKPLTIPTLGYFLNQYWFFYTLVLVTVINYLLGKIPAFVRPAVIISLLIFPFLSNLIWDLVILFYPTAKLPSWGHTGFFTLYAIVYHQAGAIFRQTALPKTACVLLILSGLMLIYFETYVMTNYSNQLYDGVNASFPTIGALLLTIGTFCLIKPIESLYPPLQHFISYIGGNALGIYIFSLSFILFVRSHLITSHGINPILAVLISIAICICCSILATFIKKSFLKFTLNL